MKKITAFDGLRVGASILFRTDGKKYVEVELFDYSKNFWNELLDSYLNGRDVLYEGFMIEYDINYKQIGIKKGVVSCTVTDVPLQYEPGNPIMLLGNSKPTFHDTDQ